MEGKVQTRRITWEMDGKEMIYIPGGGFLMGSDESQENEGPAHVVQVGAFYIDCYPVTHQEYKRFVDATGHPVPCYSVEWAEPYGYNWDAETRTPPAGKGKHPVVLVGWEDARAYAAWAGKRLPTEAEWERAARGTDGRRWPWGDECAEGHCNTRESRANGTTPVGRYSPQGDSPEGVGDMVGNVWEWTSSLFRPYPYDARDGRECQEAQGWRVLRGGSWRNDLQRAHCTARLDGDFLFFNNVGFRCVVSADAGERPFRFREPGELVDADLELVLAERYPGNPAIGYVPAYRFKMTLAGQGVEIGSIELRIGDTHYVVTYGGHIGYGVLPEYRGKHYAARACRLLLPLARDHGLKTLWITCNPDNIASRRTCELVGAELAGIVDLPEDTDMYREGERQKCRYRLDL